MKLWSEKILSVILTLILMVSVISDNVFAAEYETDTCSNYAINTESDSYTENTNLSDMDISEELEDEFEQEEGEYIDENIPEEETETFVEETETLNEETVSVSKFSLRSTANTITPYTYSYSYTTLNSVTVSPSTQTVADVLEEASKFISSMEGNYASVAANDNGALSIGKIQWHGGNALMLMRLIVSEDNTTAYNTLGSSLYNEVINSSTTWNTRILNSSEVSVISSFISSTTGKKIQDKLLDSYISSYINDATAEARGIRNAAALIIYADVANQRGLGGARTTAKYAAELAGSYSKITANEMLIASIGCYSTSNTLLYDSFVNRRLKSYEYVVSLGWTYCKSGDYLIAYNSTSAKTTAAKWIQSTLNTISNAGLTVDGSYGAATIAAVKAFQTAKELDADGIAGQKTISAMIKGLYDYRISGTTISVTPTTPSTVTSTPEESTLAISSYNYPGTLYKGDSFSLKGSLKSNYKITNVTIAVVNSSGKNVLTASAEPNATSYSLASLDSKVKFSTLETGTYTYKVTATDTSTSKTLVSKSFKVKAASTLKIGSYSYPSTLKKGAGFSINGTIKSNYKITNVEIEIVNSKEKTVLSASAEPNAKSFSIKELDSKIKFGTLAAGTYTYKVTAADAAKSQTLVNKTFTVKSDSTIKISGHTYPSKLKKGAGFSIKGTIKSSHKLTKVTIKIVNSKGKTVLSASAKPNAKSYDINKLDAKIKFGTLEKGTYTYKVTAKNTEISKTLVSKSFKVN